jgi:hypothetical protein
MAEKSLSLADVSYGKCHRVVSLAFHLQILLAKDMSVMIIIEKGLSTKNKSRTAASLSPFLRSAIVACLIFIRLKN